MHDLFSESPEENLLFAGKYPMQPYPSGTGHIITIPDGELFYAPQFFSKEISNRLLERFLANNTVPVTGNHWQKIEPQKIHWKNIPWRQDSIRIFGNMTLLPRLSSWHGDNDRPYTYSGLTLQPQPWNKPLQWLRDELFTLTNIRFNSVLMNFYRSGEDHIS